MKYCYKCKTEWKSISQPGRYTTCETCASDLHICMNCRYYNPTKSNQCEAQNSEQYVEKNRANSCDEFQFADRPVTATIISSDNKANKSRAEFDLLFKKKK